MNEQEKQKRLEELGKIYQRECNNIILTEYLGKDHPVFKNKDGNN